MKETLEGIWWREVERDGKASLSLDMCSYCLPPLPRPVIGIVSLGDLTEYGR